MMQAQGPQGFDDFRAESLQAFQQAGLPTRKDEEFRFISLHALEEEQFEMAYGATVDRADVIRASVIGDYKAHTFAFINGQPAPELSVLDQLPEGVTVTSFEEAQICAPGLLERHLGKIASLSGKLGSTNDERFVHLNGAHLQDGAVVHIGKGSQVELPIHLLFVSKADHGKFAAYPRLLIVLEEGASAQILESWIGIEGRCFTDAVTEIAVSQGANLSHVRLQDETPEAIHIATMAVHQAANSVYTGFNVNFGGAIARNELNVTLAGEHTETRLDGVTVGFGEQVLANHTRIDHAMPNCNSFEVYKTVLGDKAQGVFNGKIFVYEDAQKTDAKQTNQAMLLSPTAVIDTKPQLEIFADDVKCTHGATVGQLREEAMFYLQARGIKKSEAEAILVYAFAAEVLERIPDQELAKRLESRLYSKLEAHQG